MVMIIHTIGKNVVDAQQQQEKQPIVNHGQAMQHTIGKNVVVVAGQVQRQRIVILIPQ